MATVQPPPLALEMNPTGEFNYRPTRFARRLRGLAVIGVAVLVSLGAIYGAFVTFGGSSGEQGEMLTRKVERSDLLVTVTEDGALESASNVDIKCEVAGGSTILWIVPDGTQVTAGQDLVRLDSSVFEEQVNQQQILYEKAQALRIESEKLYSAAKIAVQEYTDGTYLQLLQTAEANITIALENQRSAENSLAHTERMARKGYVTSLQRDAQAFALKRSQLELETAQIAKNVLEKFTRAKMVEDLEAKRDAAEAKMRSDDAAFDLEASRLKRLKLQLEKCLIKAPADGMVVYANETSSFRGSTTLQIEEGTAVRERQSIIKLPDLSRMQAKVSVHESKVDQLRIGMRARVRVQGREFQGSVVSIANQPEPGSFMSSNVKKFPTIVSIDNRGDSNLRPGMTTVVEILIDDRPNVISVPVQSVVEQGDKYYAWVLAGGRPERRPLVLGVTNNIYIEVKDGLSEGDLVLLNPRAQVPEAREEVKRKDSIDVAKTFGERKPLGEGAGSARPSTGAGPGGSGRSAPSFAEMDKNSDGKITVDELPEQAKGMFDRMDADRDGGVSPTEHAAMRARMRQRQATEGGPGGGPPGGTLPAGGQ